MRNRHRSVRLKQLTIVSRLAKLWNINVWDLPAWQDPIHIMSMLQMMEAGTIKMLWISGTNPAVSLVNLERVRKILTMPGLYVSD